MRDRHLLRNYSCETEETYLSWAKQHILVADRLPLKTSETERSAFLSPRPYTTLLGRYCMASARCGVSMRSAPAKSAIVRASLRMR